jgi:nucleoside-diphosphate-sugar epimerase
MNLILNSQRKSLVLVLKINIRKLILFSTVHVYGNKKSVINEKTKLKPNNIYGKTKKISEEICNKYSNKIDVVIFRISNVIAKPIK